MKKHSHAAIVQLDDHRAAERRKEQARERQRRCRERRRRRRGGVRCYHIEVDALTLVDLAEADLIDVGDDREIKFGLEVIVETLGEVARKKRHA